MDGRFILTVNDEIIFEDYTDNVVNSLLENNDHQRNDVEGTFEWLNEKYGDADGRIIADVVPLIDSTEPLDGLGTRALFWIATLIMKNGMLKKLPLPSVFKLMLFVQNKTAVHEVKMKKNNEKTTAFLEKFKEITCMLSEEKISEDKALTEIFKSMPEKDIIEYKLETNPHFTKVFQVIKQISQRCEDEKLKILTDKVLEEFNLDF